MNESLHWYCCVLIKSVIACNLCSHYWQNALTEFYFSNIE